MPEPLVSVDLSTPASKQAQLHNRWHPDIPAVAEVDPDEVFRLECVDATGGQILNSDDAEDVAGLELGQLIYVTGPVHVRGAQPGDLLRVELLDLGSLPGSEFGYTAILGVPGAGLLPEYSRPTKAIWDIDGVTATSRHIGGVSFAGSPHPGVIGTAPSHDKLSEWNEREQGLLNEMQARPPLDIGPDQTGARLGSARDPEDLAHAAAQTWAARENGGNIDVKDFTPGSSILLPVYVEGANLSVGDLHFSQGDGKITGLGGVRIAGWVDLRCSIIEGGMERWNISAPVIFPGAIRTRYEEQFMFTGVSVDDTGRQHYLDATVAYRQACRNAISYLRQLGYTAEQAYILLSAVPVEGRLSCLLEHPNVCVTLALPAQIFDFPIDPESFPEDESRGELPTTSGE